MALNAPQDGIKAALAKLKFHPPPNTDEQVPDSYHGTYSSTTGWAILQCTDFIDELLHVLKSMSKLRPDKEAGIMPPVTDKETQGLRSIRSGRETSYLDSSAG